MNFSIIIVNYNTKVLLHNCLQTVLKNFNHKNFEIIIVDNNSTDGSVEMLERDYQKKIKLIKNDKNIGFGPANNRGAKIANGEYLFFLNSDTRIEDDIFTIVNNIFKQNKSIAIISPKLLLKNGVEQDYAFGDFPKFLNLILHKFYKKNKEDLIIDTDWVSGAAMFIRKNIFEKAGGFDEKYFMYFEDIDLCKRIKNSGYKVLYVKDCYITHLIAQSPLLFNQRKNIYYKSQDYFYKKHYSKTSLYLMRILRFPIKFISFLS